tara:strand:- start:394 stop:720 length:327 start_codon:yes stop_codon:yes gene_type:complete
MANPKLVKNQKDSVDLPRHVPQLKLTKRITFLPSAKLVKNQPLLKFPSPNVPKQRLSSKVPNVHSRNPNLPVLSKKPKKSSTLTKSLDSQKENYHVKNDSNKNILNIF